MEIQLTLIKINPLNEISYKLIYKNIYQNEYPCRMIIYMYNKIGFDCNFKWC